MAEPVATIVAILSALMKGVVSCLPGAAGAAVSLKFLGSELSRWQKLASFVAGFACAIYVAPALIELFGVEGARVHSGIEFLTGLFSMAVCRELFAEINEADFLGRFLGFLKRSRTGGDK